MKSQKIYDHQRIEEKWMGKWKTGKQENGQDGKLERLKVGTSEAEKLYLLFAFAYPSGSGLHVGHVESKTALDILARYYRMNGKDVFFPVGWDAFGLPAENYAVKTGVHPAETTKKAIDTFRSQIKRLGISYDWDHEIATSHPGYYKWTQWLFLELYKKGLAYQAEGKVNWCPSCQTVLANEQVVNGECERCGSEVIQKELKQWYFKITDYKDELISGLDSVDWPEATKDQQLNWIGKKEGINIEYKIENLQLKIENGGTITCFTTRPDTNFGATFIVIAPEHQLVQDILSKKLTVDDQAYSDIAQYVDQSEKKTELERQMEGKKKSGVFSSFFAINQLTGKKMPIYISDFVLAGFGTGAVVGVPGHDLRDYQFAKFVNKSGIGPQIDIVRVVVGSDGDESQIQREEQVQEEAGTMINSDFLNGLDVHEATHKIMDYLENKGWGKKVTTYKLRDWLISRQRYWGAPIPIVYDPEGQPHPVKEEHLPWLLPDDVEFKPTGESPLTHSQEFKKRVERLYGKGWRPEYDTMDTFVDSSWYYLRYPSARLDSSAFDSDLLQKWLPVDFYMIGPEHIVLHLLYSRFFTKFLRDQGYLNFDEPFLKMRHQGMILGPDGRKMSKSKGNVINPDEIIAKFGADTLRIYEMFMGPIEADKPWDGGAVVGVYRFLVRIFNLIQQSLPRRQAGKIQDAERMENGKTGKLENGKDTEDGAQSNNSTRKLHQTINKVSQDIPQLKFNTAIASMMELVNVWEKEIGKMENGKTGKLENGKDTEKLVLKFDQIVMFVKLLAPFAPFLAEELWQDLGQGGSVHESAWPVHDEKLAMDQEITIVVQINGKVRGQISVSSDLKADKEQLINLAKKDPSISKWLGEAEIKKEIYIPGKIISLVI